MKNRKISKNVKKIFQKLELESRIKEVSMRIEEIGKTGAQSRGSNIQLIGIPARVERIKTGRKLSKK